MNDTFSETLGKIQFNGDNLKHHYNNQEGQGDQEYPPSTGRFLVATFAPMTPCIIYFWKP